MKKIGELWSTNKSVHAYPPNN